MNIFVKLGQDIVRLWDEFGSLYLSGVWNTVSLAVLCTAVGCLIGLLCGVGDDSVITYEIDCEAVGDAADTVKITEKDGQITVEFQ